MDRRMRAKIKPHAPVLYIVMKRDDPGGAFTKGEEGTAIELIPSAEFEFVVTLEGHYHREYMGHHFMATRRFYMNQKDNFYFIEKHKTQDNVLKRRIISNEQSTRALDPELTGD